MAIQGLRDYSSAKYTHAVGEWSIMTIVYVYTWGNNSKRVTLRGRQCVVVARGAMNSAVIEFVDNGQRECVSRNALRRATP
jgi:hypothetical protein